MGEVIANAGSTLMDMVPDITTLPCASVTFTAKLKVPATTVDAIVPLMVPAVHPPLTVVAHRVRPVGRLPELSAQLKGPTPPVCASVAVK